MDNIVLGIGDMVVIDKYENCRNTDVPCSYTYSMRKYETKLAKVVAMSGSCRNHTRIAYKLDIDRGYYSWSIDMFSHVIFKNTNKLVKVIKRPDLY